MESQKTGKRWKRWQKVKEAGKGHLVRTWQPSSLCTQDSMGPLSARANRSGESPRGPGTEGAGRPRRRRRSPRARWALWGPREPGTLSLALTSRGLEGVGGAEPGAAPRSRPRSRGPGCQRPLPRPLTRRRRAPGRSGGDPRLGHDPRSGRQRCLAGQASL